MKYARSINYLKIRSSLCAYSDAYILAKGIITVANTEDQDQDNKGADKNVIFKNYI